LVFGRVGGFIRRVRQVIILFFLIAKRCMIPDIWSMSKADHCPFSLRTMYTFWLVGQQHIGVSFIGIDANVLVITNTEFGNGTIAECPGCNNVSPGEIGGKQKSDYSNDKCALSKLP
jgi:hypothetical protein